MQILTWNIQWGRGADGIVDLDRTLSVLRELPEADVICLQEVAVNMASLPGGGAGEDVLERIASALQGFTLLYLPCVDALGDNGLRSEFGNAVLSHFPVLATRSLLLPRPVDPGVMSMQRGALEITIETDGRRLRIQTTHLEYYSNQQRLAQIHRLRDIQIETRGLAKVSVSSNEANPTFCIPPLPASLVLCGDFNLSPEMPDYAALAGSDADDLWRDAWSVAHPGVAHAHTVGLHGAEWPDHPYCCDYFLVSSDLQGAVREVRVLSETAASDHQPVLLELA